MQKQSAKRNWLNILLLLTLWATSSDNTLWADQEPAISDEIEVSPETSTHTDSETSPEELEAGNEAEGLRVEPGDNFAGVGNGFSLPPKVLQSLLQSAGPARTMEAEKLSLRMRLLLALAALGAIMVGVLVCQLLTGRLVREGQEASIFLIFGLFSAMGALCLACGLVGSLRLHLVAVLCTLVSGFCIGGIGVGPLPWFRTWLLGENAKKNGQ